MLKFFNKYNIYYILFSWIFQQKMLNYWNYNNYSNNKYNNKKYSYKKINNNSTSTNSKINNRPKARQKYFLYKVKTLL